MPGDIVTCKTYGTSWVAGWACLPIVGEAVPIIQHNAMCHRLWGGACGRIALAGIVLVIAPARGLFGQSTMDTVRITLREARDLSFRRNPELAAARLDVDVARGDFRQASALFPSNPTVEYLTEGRSGNGPEGSVVQEIEIFNQRGARRGAARAGIDRATAGVENTARLTIGETDRLFYRLIAAERRTDLAGEVLGLNQRLTDVVQRQLEAGKVSRLEFNLATVELGRSRARALSARRERDQVALDFARLLGVPQGTTIVAVADSSIPLLAVARDSVGVPPIATRESLQLDIDSLTALALARRPDLAEREAAARQASAAALAWPFPRGWARVGLCHDRWHAPAPSRHREIRGHRRVPRAELQAGWEAEVRCR